MQDVFGAVWTARATIEIKTSVRAYLYTSVRNRALNLRKHEAVADDWDRDESSDDVRELHPRPLQPDVFARPQASRSLNWMPRSTRCRASGDPRFAFGGEMS